METAFDYLWATNYSVLSNSSTYMGDPNRCYILRDTAACVRISVAFLIAFCSLLAALARAVHCHVRKHKLYHHYFILYSIAMQSAILGVHFLVPMTRAAVVDFVVTYILAVQVLLLCHHYVGWAARSQHHDKIFKFAFIPLLVLLLLYFTAVLIWAGIEEEQASLECHDQQWVLFSGSNFFLSLIFLIAGIYITKYLVTVRNRHKCFVITQLWGFVVGYEFSMGLAFIYDLYLTLARPPDCGHIFSTDSSVYVVTYLIHRTVKYFVPAWTAIVFIHPNKLIERGGGYTPIDDVSDSLNWAQNKNFKSTFFKSAAERQPIVRQTSPVAVNYSPYTVIPQSQGYGSGPADSCPENPSQVFSRGSSYGALPPVHSTHRASSGFSSYRT